VLQLQSLVDSVHVGVEIQKRVRVVVLENLERLEDLRERLPWRTVALVVRDHADHERILRDAHPFPDVVTAGLRLEHLRRDAVRHIERVEADLAEFRLTEP